MSSSSNTKLNLAAHALLLIVSSCKKGADIVEASLKIPKIKLNS